MVVSQSGTYQTTMRQPIFHRPRQKTRHAQRQKSRITHSISSISKDVDEYQYSIQIIIICIPRINSTYNLRLTCRNPCYHTSIRYGKNSGNKKQQDHKNAWDPKTKTRKHRDVKQSTCMEGAQIRSNDRLPLKSNLRQEENKKIVRK